jgi:FkbM family methyltransferase
VKEAPLAEPIAGTRAGFLFLDVPLFDFLRDPFIFAMKSVLSFVVRALRHCFYNTPVKNWKVTQLIYAVVGRLMIGNDPYPTIQLEGMKLKANGQDVVVTAALANGNYEPFTIRVFRRLIEEALKKSENEACVFVDVGANIGLFTVTAALLNPRVQVFAFEPNVTSYQLLEENLQLNGLRNVSAQQAAVGQKRGRASLDISSPQAGCHSIYSSGTRRIEVDVICLDDLFSTKHVLPSIIKVDVEGYEPQVFHGMKNLPPRHEFQMILEFNPGHLERGGEDPGAFLEELASQFDFIYCLDEIGQVAIPYVSGDVAVKEKIIGFGYNLLLIRGTEVVLF